MKADKKKLDKIVRDITMDRYNINNMPEDSEEYKKAKRCLVMDMGRYRNFIKKHPEYAGVKI